jgi:adenylate cyclase
VARNLEIKARVRDWEGMHARAAALADGPAELIAQEDTFFRVADGRLKLRVFADGTGELIFYQRPDAEGPKESRYLRTPLPEPAPLRESLAAAWGEIGRVVKRRTLYLVGRTRIHLDEVEGLGRFMELELILADGERPEDAEAEARGLMQALGVAEGDLVEGAYLDLLGAILGA